MLADVQAVIKRGCVNAVIFGVMHIEQNFGLIGRRKASYGAKPEFIFFAAAGIGGRHVWVCHDIIQRRILRQISSREAEREDITDRESRAGVQVNPLEISELGREIARLFLTGQDGIEINRAAGGVTAIERTLRAFQNFGAVYVKKERAGLNIGGLVNTVDIDSRSGGGEGLMIHRANSANLKSHLTAICHGRLKAGDFLRQLFCTVQLRQVFPVDNGHA